MLYSVTDRVRATQDLDFQDRTWPAGSAGAVRALAPLGEAYWVLFDGDTHLRLVPECQLEPDGAAPPVAAGRG